MKFIKKDTTLTLSRDAIRLLFAINFYFLAKTLGLEFELETEYVVLGSIIILGPLFCGWLCPFGAASYFMTRLGNKLSPKLQYTIPQPYDGILRLIRYPLLILFLYLFTVKGVSYFGDHIEMYKSNVFSSTYITLKHYAVLLIPLFIPRFFCKYMCFQKAGYNLINRLLKITTIKRDADTCISCGKCDKLCPMQVRPSAKTIISGDDCISCYNCLDSDACPKRARSLSLTFWGYTVNHLHFAVGALCIYALATAIILFGYV